MGEMPTGVSFVVADLSRLEVRVRFDELDGVRIAAGQRATVAFDALPGAKLEGVVDKVSPGASGQAGGPSFYRYGQRPWFEVAIRLLQTDPRLKPGITAEAEIVVAERRGVLSLPVEAIHEDKTGVWVSLVRGRRTQRQPVKLGLRTQDKVEVVEGLRAGDRVQVPTPKRPRRGLWEEMGEL